MIDDLKVIKKLYGEKMSHLCRELFPTILEEPGKLSTLLQEKFEPSKILYEDLILNGMKEPFKNYIYSLTEIEQQDIIVNKTPTELLSEAGYDLYECKTEADIAQFQRYYAPGEELCTFDGGRLSRCYVFFAVKKDVDKIKRKDFPNPTRQDAYGTSVISIQFSRGSSNTLSIKNRYNHTVENPDATFSNNLDNIILGLTDSFEREYGYNLSHNRSGFEIPGYVNVNGKYYKYNYELDNIYYCPNNLIIDNFEVKRDYQQMERYLIVDYFIIDLQEKRVFPYKDKIRDPDLPDCYSIHKLGEDPFFKTFKRIKDIKIVKNKSNGNKVIYIYTNHKEPIEIEINKANQMIRYKNNHIRKLPDRFLGHNRYLNTLELNNVVKIGKNCLYFNNALEHLSLKSIYEIGECFLYRNKAIKQAILPKNFFISDGFLGWDQVWDPQPVGVKNPIAKSIKGNSIYVGVFELLHIILRIAMKQTVKLSNSLMNKQQMNFQDDSIKIVSIKKSNSISHLIDYLLTKTSKTKELEEVKGKIK